MWANAASLGGDPRRSGLAASSFARYLLHHVVMDIVVCGQSRLGVISGLHACDADYAGRRWAEKSQFRAMRTVAGTVDEGAGCGR